MKRWWIVIALLLSVGVNLGVLAALAVDRFGPRENRRPQRPPYERFDGVRDAGDLARGVGMDPESTRRFRGLHQEFFESAHERRRQSMELRRELLRELTATAPDRSHIEELLEQIAGLELELEKAMVDTTLKAREMLEGEAQEHYLRFLTSRLMRVGGGRPPGGFSPGSPGPPGRGRNGRRPGSSRPSPAP